MVISDFIPLEQQIKLLTDRRLFFLCCINSSGYLASRHDRKSICVIMEMIVLVKGF